MFSKHTMQISRVVVLALTLTGFLAGCDPQFSAVTMMPETPVATPSIPVSPPTPIPDPPSGVIVWKSPHLPDGISEILQFPPQVQITTNASEANAQVVVLPATPGVETPDTLLKWVYVLVAPFPTIADNVSLNELRSAWLGEGSITFSDTPINLTRNTLDVFTAFWGTPAGGATRVIDAEILETSWEAGTAWALIPFEMLEPRWKVIRVDGFSPTDKAFDPATYPLTVNVGAVGDQVAVEAVMSAGGTAGSVSIPANRDPEKLTVVVMTGTTAMVRNLAERMEENGITYPGEEIGNWLREADITHISNEVPFKSDCVADKKEMRFCSKPEYLELLEYIGTDVVELTGNHILDWRADALLFSLDLYDEAGIATFGGGRNLLDSLQPARFEVNGNRIAFIGCSPAGPETVWAQADLAGSAPCNFTYIGAQIDSLVAEGYQVIATLQDAEVDDYQPFSTQRINSRTMVDLGATLVSGSQAHHAQGMSFNGAHFIHYGLGNTFFDQMEEDKRLAFIDRHVFYDGRYISTELLTTVLEDYAQPRPMTIDERRELLTSAFAASGWDHAFP